MSDWKVPLNQTHAVGVSREAIARKLKAKTTTGLRSGVLVIRDTDDDHIQVAGVDAVNVLGVLGKRNYTNPAWDHTTAPAEEDVLEVIPLGFASAVVARNGAALLAGAKVGSTAGGLLKAANASLPLSVVGYVPNDSDGSSAAVDALVVI
jgi:hypothetical protein